MNWHLFDQLGRLLVKFRLVVVVGLVALTVYLATWLPVLNFDFTPQALFDNADEASNFSAQIRDEFGDDSNVVFILYRSADRAPGSIYSPENLRGIRQLTAELQQWELTRNVVSLTNLEVPRLSGFGMMARPKLVPILPEGEITAEHAARVRHAIDGQDLFERVLISADGTKSIVLVEMQPITRGVNELVPAVNELRSRVGRWQQELPGTPLISISGMPAVRVDMITELKNEQLRFIPLAAGFSLFLLFFMFRRPSGMFLPMGAVTMAVVWLLAILAIKGEPFNIITNALPTLLLIIGLSDGIHLLSRMAEEIRAGKSRAEAVRETVRHIGLACLLTSFTTAVGFAALIVARTSILKSFALTASVGVMLAYLATMLFIPPMLMWMKPPIRPGLQATATGRMERLLRVCCDFVLRFPRPIFIVTLLITVGAGAVATQITVDAHLLETFPENHPTTQLTKEVERDFAGVVSMQVSVESNEPGYFTKPENLRKLDDFQAAIEGLDPDYVGATTSIVDLLDFIADSLGIDRENASPMQIRQTLEMLRREAPDLSKQVIDAEARHALITLRLRDFGARYGINRTRQLETDIDRIFGESASAGILAGMPPPADAPIKVRFAGDGYLAGIGLITLIHDLLGTMGLAAGVIFVVMMLLFRSLRIGLISVLPNTLPLVLTFGLMAILGMELSTTTAIVFSIGLGLAVDDTVHFLSRYLEERARTSDIRKAIRRSYVGVGRAMLITTITMLGGMAVLLQTTFMPIKYLAILLGFIICGALIGDLLLLPAMLALFDRIRHPQPPESTDSIALPFPGSDAAPKAEPDAASEAPAEAAVNSNPAEAPSTGDNSGG